LFLTLLLLAAVTHRSSAQATHLIKLQAEGGEDGYRVVPQRVVAHVNDVLIFKVVSGEPHSITFEADGLSPQAHDALNQALKRRSADLTSPLLTAPGAEYRVEIPAIPKGRYRFYCLPHRAYDERGVLVIE
jgi:plastocyanin